MPEVKIELQEPYYSMLVSFKPVVETVIEGELDFDSYVVTVIWRGVQAILEDIVPKDPETLMKSIVLMHESNPEFVASFINRMLLEGTERESAKQRLGFIKGE